MAEVTLKNLNKKYGDVIAVQNMNLKFHKLEKKSANFITIFQRPPTTLFRVRLG